MRTPGSVLREGVTAPADVTITADPPAFIVFVILYAAFEVFIFAVVLLLARWVFEEIAGWAVVVGNLLAATGTLAYDVTQHPGLVRQLKVTLAEGDDQ